MTNVKQHQAVSDPQIKPTDYDFESACTGCYCLYSPC